MVKPPISAAATPNAEKANLAAVRLEHDRIE